MKECAKLNGDLRQDEIDLLNVDIGNTSDDSSTSSNDQFENNFDSRSMPDSHSTVADRVMVSEDEESAYVSMFLKGFR